MTHVYAPYNRSTVPNPDPGPGEVYVFYGMNRSDYNEKMDLKDLVPDITLHGGLLLSELQEGMYGDSIAVGDFNDDGCDDILASEPWADNDHGMMYLWNGRARNQTKSFYRVAVENNWSAWSSEGEKLTSGDINGDGYDDFITSRGLVYFGPNFMTNAVAPGCAGSNVAVGDINNDGCEDIIIGDPEGKDPITGTDLTGVVYVIRGRPPGMGISRSLTISGSQLRDYLGSAVAIGDINGDGFGEIYMAGYGGDGWNNQKAGCGEGYIIYGTDSHGLGLNPGDQHAEEKSFRITDIKDITIYGADKDDSFGWSAHIHDIDQDGFGDLQLCAPGGDGPNEDRQDCGETYLFFGDDEGLPSTIDISENLQDLTIYGVDKGDKVGTVITSGDMDMDGFIDIIISSTNADGDKNMNKNCGEAYVIFATGLRTKEFGLIGGYDPDTRAEGTGRICFSGHKDYVMYSTISNSEGVEDLDNVVLTLDPEGANVTVKWDESSRTFSEISDPQDVIKLNSLGSSKETEGNNATIKFKFIFDWDFPADQFKDVMIRVANDSGVAVQARYHNVFYVENDLDLAGELDVASSVIGNIDFNGSFCPQEGVVNWTGFKVVYQDTRDIFPPEDAFDVSVSNSKGIWYDNDTSGTEIFITTEPPHMTNNSFGVRYDMNIISLPGDATDVSDVFHFLRTDSYPPDPPTGLTIYPDDLQGPPGNLDDDTSVFLKWDPIIDKTSGEGEGDGVGINRYFVSTEDGSGTTNGLEAWGTGGLIGDYYNSDNFINYEFSKLDPEMDLDWGYWSPHDQILPLENFSIRWRGKLEFPENGTYIFYIEADDGAKIWIDGELYFDEWRLGRPTQVMGYFTEGPKDIRIEFRDKLDKAKFKMEWPYGTQERTTIGWDDLLHPSEWYELKDLEQGNNTIYVWAEDRYGNIGNAASVNIKIDSEGPYFIEPKMSDDWYTKKDILVGVKAVDDVAGISDDIQVTTSTSGLDGYEDWEKVPFGLIEWDEENGSGAFEFEKTFKEGTRNYIRFRAKDLLGNGYSASKDYQIKIDTTPIEIGWIGPENNSVHNDKLVYVNVSFDDPGGSGVDVGSVMYRYTTTGDMADSQWTDVPTGNVTLFGEDKHAYAYIGIYLEEGTKNWVQFKARDIAGTDIVHSELIHFTVDIPIINEAPIAVISNPAHNSTFLRGRPITFDASNTTDDGHRQPLQFTWYSSWDGYLGSGKVLEYKRPLYIGEHDIRLKVYDGFYNVSTKITIHIENDPDPSVPINPEIIDGLNDTDGDGMMDSWEQEFFGGIDVSDGTEDSDGDGYSDKLEYLYDSDPKSKNDTPPLVVPKDSEKKETQTNNDWMIIVLILVIIIIAIAAFYMYLKKQQQLAALKGDGSMIMRSKTQDDVDEEGRPIDDEYDVKIEKKTKKEREKERAGMYGKEYTKRSKKKKGRRKQVEDNGKIAMPGDGVEEELEQEEDPFGEKEFDDEGLDEVFDDPDLEDDEHNEYDDEFDYEDVPEDFTEDDLEELGEEDAWLDEEM